MNLRITKKNIIISIVVWNLLIGLYFAYAFHYKEKWFDRTQQPKVDIKNITKIEVREGGWKWDNREWKHSNETKSIITDKMKIIELCKTIENSHSEYIDNIRPNQWLNIYFYYNNGPEELSIVVKENETEGVFFEYGDNRYDGKNFSETLNEITND